MSADSSMVREPDVRSYGGVRGLFIGLMHSFGVTIGRSHPTQIPATWLVTLSLPFLWVILSAWADVRGLGSTWVRGVSGGLLEVFILTGLLYAVCRLRKFPDRFFVSWLALCGVSACMWGISGLLLVLGFYYTKISSLVALIAVMIAVQGYSHILKTLDPSIEYPHTFAFQGLILSWVLWYALWYVLWPVILNIPGAESASICATISCIK